MKRKPIQRRVTPHAQPHEGLSELQLAELQRRIGIAFRDPRLLEQALTHRSYLNENRNGRITRHNEVLEFLGDAVLELAVTDKLVRMFPDLQEGKLTSYRSALINTRRLSAIAQELGLEPFLLMSRGEARDTGRARHYILGCAFEAIVGALYLDRGQGVAELFLADVLFGNIQEVVMKRQYLDAKSHLQELAQERLHVTPHYEVLEERGPDHDKWFRIGCYFHMRLVSEGTGGSKREAEDAAARAALQKEYGVTLEIA